MDRHMIHGYVGCIGIVCEIMGGCNCNGRRLVIARRPLESVVWDRGPARFYQFIGGTMGTFSGVLLSEAYTPKP